MDDDAFWAIMDRSVSDNPEAQLDELRAELAALAPHEIVAFDTAFSRQSVRAYRWDLWGAAYVIHGGCSDDSFHYFCSWLISRGHFVFEAVLAAPETLAEGAYALGPDGGFSFEEIAYAAAEVWSAKTGKDVESFPFDHEPLPAEPAGQPWNEDPDELTRLYPKLWARYGDNPLA